MKALSYHKVDASIQTRRNTNGISRFLKATALAISTLLPINANAIVNKEEQKLPAISLDGSLRVWNSVWRSHKYYYAKKGRKWNSAARVASGVLGYYGIYGMRAAKIDADGCVSCSEPVVSPRKLTEQETEKLGLELVGIEMTHSTQVHDPINDRNERLILFLTHGEDKKHEIEAALASLEHGFPSHLHTLHVGHQPSALSNEHDGEHSNNQESDHHGNYHRPEHYAEDHDPLAHIAHMGSGHGHNPLWMIHMYALHVGHEHLAIEHDGEHESGNHQEHEGHHSGHHHGLHFVHSEHDPLAHIAHMGSGHGHNPLWMIHMYALHVGHEHLAVGSEHGEHRNVGHDTVHDPHAEIHEIPIGLIFDLREIKRTPLIVAAALPPLE